MCNHFTIKSLEKEKRNLYVSCIMTVAETRSYLETCFFIMMLLLLLHLLFFMHLCKLLCGLNSYSRCICLLGNYLHLPILAAESNGQLPPQRAAGRGFVGLSAEWSSLVPFTASCMSHPEIFSLLLFPPLACLQQLFCRDRCFIT